MEVINTFINNFICFVKYLYIFDLQETNIVDRGIIYIFLFWLGASINISAQEITHQVLVPVAGITSNGSINYSQTIGETAVEIINCSEYVFTQGFQQPGIKEPRTTPPPGNGVKVYPNPVTEYVSVELFGNGPKAFRIEFLNISGTIIRMENLTFSNQYWHIQQFAVDKFSNGLFFIRVLSTDGMINRTFKIEKM